MIKFPSKTASIITGLLMPLFVYIIDKMNGISPFLGFLGILIFGMYPFIASVFGVKEMMNDLRNQKFDPNDKIFSLSTITPSKEFLLFGLGLIISASLMALLGIRIG